MTKTSVYKVCKKVHKSSKVSYLEFKFFGSISNQKLWFKGIQSIISTHRIGRGFKLMLDDTLGQSNIERQQITELQSISLKSRLRDSSFNSRNLHINFGVDISLTWNSPDKKMYISWNMIDNLFIKQLWLNL